MAKMSKSERAECEKNLALCKAAVETFNKMLAEDDEAAEATKAAAHSATIQGILQRDGAAAAIMAIREAGRRPGRTE